MRDIDALVGALRAAAPPPPAPPWPTPRRRAPIVLAALALAAVVLAARWTGSRDRPGLVPRGIDGGEASGLDLRMVVVRDGAAERVDPGDRANRGEEVLFRVQADRDTEARLWVDGPEGEQTIAVVRVGPMARDVADEQGLIGYRLERAGSYSFHLSPRASACDDCPVLALEVR